MVKLNITVALVITIISTGCTTQYSRPSIDCLAPGESILCSSLVATGDHPKQIEYRRKEQERLRRNAAIMDGFGKALEATAVTLNSAAQAHSQKSPITPSYSSNSHTSSGPGNYGRVNVFCPGNPDLDQKKAECQGQVAAIRKEAYAIDDMKESSMMRRQANDLAEQCAQICPKTHSGNPSGATQY